MEGEEGSCHRRSILKIKFEKNAFKYFDWTGKYIINIIKYIYILYTYVIFLIWVLKCTLS